MSDNSIVEITVAIIMAIPGFISLRSVIKQRNANADHEKADEKRIAGIAANQISEAAGELVTQYKAYSDVLSAEVDDLRSRLNDYNLKSQRQAKECKDEIKKWNDKLSIMQSTIDRLRIRLREYREGVQILSDQIRDLGHNPKYIPPDEDGEL